MFYFRINRLKVYDNREKGFLFFGKGKAEIKLLSFISTDHSGLPDMSGYLETNDPGEKRAILENAVKSIISTRVFHEATHIKDGHIFTFGDAGYVLYQNQQIPQDIHWLLLAYESDQKLREQADLAEKVLQRGDFKSLGKSVEKVLKAAANPYTALGLELITFVGRTLVQVAKNDKDDLVGVSYASWNRVEHYPHGIRDKRDMRDMLNNMSIDYTMFGYEDGIKKALEKAKR
ncbi:MAG: hypothetical protein ACRBG0_01435 [Lewinella sp.]|uniref:hypothetical protein n=1 Tax=Lewinella sp. TaxID=2004506 RepID=UPI003D6B0860